MQSTDLLYTIKKASTHPVPLAPAGKGSYKKKVGILIVLLCILKLGVAFSVELGNDESYYWLYSQQIKWNYFDHPPMVALWVRLFTGNLWLEDYPGFIRLGSIVASALATLFMFKTAAELHSERAGWFAACLYNASYYAGITAGLTVIPDAPQMVFWTFCLWMIAKIMKEENRWPYWILLGIGAGLCIMSKVHGVFIWFGLGLYIILYKRAWLGKLQLYTALLLTFVIALPILIWNIQNNFVTYQFHSQRVVIETFTINTYGFLKELVSQFFYNNPFNVVLILAAAFAWRKRKQLRAPALTVYSLIGWPLALILLLIALFRNTTLPHWSGPAYISLLPLAAVALAQRAPKKPFPNWLRWSLGAFVGVLLALTLAIHFYPGTFGSKKGEDLGRGDYSLDVYGWKEAAQQFSVLYQQEVQQGRVPAGTPLVSYKWWGAHIEYYFCRPLGVSMIGLGTLNDLHEYMWLNTKRKDAIKTNFAYCVIPSDEYYDVYQKYSGYYTDIQKIKTIRINRNNKAAHYFYVYRLQGWKGALPMAP